MSTETNLQMAPGSVKAVMKEINSKSRDLWFVGVNDILVIDGFNVRDQDDEYRAHIRMLADSIKANGFFAHKPLVGYIERQGDKSLIRLTDGHSRLEAVKLAISEGFAIEKLPFVPHPSGTSMEDLIVGLATDNAGKPLKPMELARVCKRLAGFGLDNAEIARRLSITGSYVTQLMILLSAPKQVRDMVSAGEVSASTAIATVREHGEKAVETLEAAQAVAKSSGKTKVTAKMLAAPKVDSMALGVQWIKANCPVHDLRFPELLCAVTGKQAKDVLEALGWQ